MSGGDGITIRKYSRDGVVIFSSVDKWAINLNHVCLVEEVMGGTRVCDDWWYVCLVF